MATGVVVVLLSIHVGAAMCGMFQAQESCAAGRWPLMRLRMQRLTRDAGGRERCAVADCRWSIEEVGKRVVQRRATAREFVDSVADESKALRLDGRLEGRSATATRLLGEARSRREVSRELSIAWCLWEFVLSTRRL